MGALWQCDADGLAAVLHRTVGSEYRTLPRTMSGVCCSAFSTVWSSLVLSPPF